MTAKKLSALMGLMLGLCFLAIGAEPEPGKLPKVQVPDFAKATAHPVVRIVDGDTIVVSIDNDDVKVRLIGVDTPETVHPSKPVQEYGKEASRFTTNLLKGEDVYLLYEGEKAQTDKYGRTLAYV